MHTLPPAPFGPTLPTSAEVLRHAHTRGLETGYVGPFRTADGRRCWPSLCPGSRPGYGPRAARYEQLNPADVAAGTYPAEVCGGTGEHVGQTVTTCDECDPDHESAWLAGGCEACGNPRGDDPDFCPACIDSMHAARSTPTMTPSH